MRHTKQLGLALGMAALLGCNNGVIPPEEEPPPPPAPREPEPAFLISELLIPQSRDEVSLFGQDYNQDGEVDDDDNALRDLARLPDRLETLSNIAAFFGFDIDINIELDLQGAITDALLSGELILGTQLSDDLLNGQGTFTIFQATVIGSAVPSFNGQDEIQPEIPLPFTAELVESDSGISFRTRPGNFFFTLPLEGAQLLPLQNTVFTGTLADPFSAENFLSSSSGIQNGSFSGTIRASDFAKQLEALGAAFAAEDSELLSFLDDNENGKLDAVFDPETGVFIENELSLIFDIELDDGAPGEPSGFIGNLFRLDMDGDGVAESMGIGLGLSAVTALIPE